MSHEGNTTDVNAIARTIDVDNRLPLRYYYRIAETLLKQANIYRAENNVVDLYAILLRFSSLVSETIPFHRDYQSLHQRDRKLYREKLLPVLDELESLKPEFQRRRKELKSALPGCESYQVEGSGKDSYDLERYSQSSLSPYEYYATTTVSNQLQPANKAYEFPRQQTSSYSQSFSSTALDVDQKLQKLSFTLPLPKEETLSRHSFLGQNGLRGQWQGPTTSTTKIFYPSHADFTEAKSSGDLSQNGVNALVAAKDGNSGPSTSVMESILSLDDGRWSKPAENSYSFSPTLKTNDKFMPSSIIRQPAPPPSPAQVHPAVRPISPSRVADPRPGPATKDNMQPLKYQHVHIPVRMLEDFLRLAEANTRKNLETCGVLAGSLKNRVFHISTLIIPKQESTSDSCSTLNEEEIFEVQDKNSLFPLGWIHTHPSQTCFMSSVDLHTHYSYQVMLPEAIAIVMAPTDTSSPHGIFHLSDPGGVSLIKNCQQRGFHPHEEPEDGSPLYEHCSHVYMNPSSRFDVLDLRCK